MLSERRRNYNAETIEALLKDAREKAGLTQKAVADAAAPSTYTMISQLEVCCPPAVTHPNGVFSSPAMNRPYAGTVNLLSRPQLTM